MKNGIKTALTVGFILLVLGMALIALPLLRGGSIQDLWNSAHFDLSVVSTGFGNLRDYTVCRSGEESFSPAEVRCIDLGWISGTVTMEPGGDRLQIKESSSQPLTEEQKLCWKLENGTLYLRFCSAAQTSIPGKDLVLRFPAGWTAEEVSISVTSGDVELRGLRVDQDLTVGATSGDLRLTDCRCGDLEAGATSGSVGLQDCECRTLALSATSGALQAEGCVCGSIEAGTTSGSIYIGSSAKAIELSSTSGSIRCEKVPADCDVSIGATSGTVRLSLMEAGDSQRIEIETTSGDVYLDMPGAIDLDYDTASGDLSGRLTQGGDGCPRVDVETTSGDLILGAFD